MSRPVLPSQSFQRGLVEDIRFASEALAVAIPRMSKPPGKPLPTRTASRPNRHRALLSIERTTSAQASLIAPSPIPRSPRAS